MYRSNIIGASCVELTQEEYNNLSDIQKNNGTLYFITDVTGGDPIVHPTIYSENEREIGVWIDGKPLYEKTIATAKEKFGDAMTLNTGVSDMENLVYSEWCVTGELNVTPPVEISGTYIRCEHTGNGVLIIGISDKQFNPDENRTWYLTIRYTKTTDAAGSGTWTPQGVPSHHYSTDEQVIGTWIDGSTLYEKTFKITTPAVGETTVQHGISNFGEAIEITGTVKRTNGIYQSIGFVASADDFGWCATLYDLDSTQFIINLGSKLTNISSVFVTIQYTKSSL